MHGSTPAPEPFSGAGVPETVYPSDVYSRPDQEPRVLLLSLRNVESNRAMVTQYEFEDVICELDAARLLAPTRPPRSEAEWLAVRLLNGVRKRAGLRKTPFMPRVTVDSGPYDLFFATFHFPFQLNYLDRLGDWRRRCRTAVCFLIEVWSKQLPQMARYLRLLDQFDKVYVFNRASIENLRRYTSAPLAFLPTATDTLRFANLPPEVPRVIDCFSYGRRSPATHAAMLDLARYEQFFYVYDTLGVAPVADYVAHRELLAAMLKRSRYTIAYTINENRKIRTGGEEALAVRYFEGAAAGTIMLGSRPNCSEWDECFHWPDAVIDLPYEPADVRATLAELDAQPQRLAAARRNAITTSLRRHDWVHRWARVLDDVGMPHTAAMRTRAKRLDDLALAASNGAGQVPGVRIAAAASTPALAGAIRAVAPRAATASLGRSLDPSLFRIGGEKGCPNCAEFVAGTAAICPHCGERLSHA